MYYAFVLLYLMSMFMIVAAFTLHLTVKAKNLTALSVLAKQKTTTWVMSTILVFNLCDFFILYFTDINMINPIGWMYVVENLLEILIAYAVLAMGREYINKSVPRWVDASFVAIVMLSLYFDAVFSVETGSKEATYAVTMVILNVIPILILLSYSLRFAQMCFKRESGHENNRYILAFEFFCILLCALTTLNTIDSRTSHDFILNDEYYYTVVWMLFNCFCFFFVWKTLSVDDRSETQRVLNPEERLNFVAETYALSDREKEIARLISDGKNNKEIAAVLFLSPNTVKVHASNLYRKLGAANRVQAMQVLRGETIANTTEE